MPKLSGYATHKTRYSDSSLYDEVCTVCGARDLYGDMTDLDRTCPGYSEDERPDDHDKE